MIITLTGENKFGLQAELRNLIAVFSAEHGEYGIERLDAEEADFARLQEAVLGLPFLTSRKLVILRAASKNKEFSEKFEHILADVAESTDVILVEPKLDKRLSYYKFLKSKTDFREFSIFDENRLVQWAIKYTHGQSGTLSTTDARYLVERVGLNQQVLANELDKLLLYDAHITRTVIDLLTDETPQSTIFQLLESVFAGDIDRALQLYGEQRALKVEVSQIIAMLSWQLHILALIKTAGNRTTAQIAQETKINPFVLRKNLAVSKDISLADLKQKISALLQLDFRVKRTNIDADEAMQLYIITP